MPRRKLTFFEFSAFSTYLANLSVVSLGGLLLEVLPLLELLAVRKRDTIDALQALSVAVALPVRRRVLGQLERLDLAGVLDVRATTQVNERAAPVHGGGRCVDLLVEDSAFELIVL